MPRPCTVLQADACVCPHRMTVYSRCGIPPRAGARRWWCRTPRTKSLLPFTSPSSTWPILARSPGCPGGRPASSCPSRNNGEQHHVCFDIFWLTFLGFFRQFLMLLGAAKKTCSDFSRCSDMSDHYCCLCLAFCAWLREAEPCRLLLSYIFFLVSTDLNFLKPPTGTTGTVMFVNVLAFI